VRRLSVANLDSGAESPVYGEEPSASAERGPVVNPPRADGDGRRAIGGGRTVAGRNFAPGVGRPRPRGLRRRHHFASGSAVRGDARRHGNPGLGHSLAGRGRHSATCDKL
jgi:hypothetical protein